MLTRRASLRSSFRVLAAAVIFTILPLAAPTSPVFACTPIYWNGSTPNDTLYIWSVKNIQGITNWDDNNGHPVILSSNDREIFPQRAINKVSINDKTGSGGTPFLVNSIWFPDSTGYRIEGKPIQVSSGIVDDAAAGLNTLALNIAFPSSQSILAAGTSTLEFSGNISGRSTLTFGSASNPSTYTGTVLLDGPQNTFTGNIKVASGTLQIGRVSATNYTMAPGTTLAVNLAAANPESLLVVTGKISLGGATLALLSEPGVYASQPIVIVDNQGTLPVYGTFKDQSGNPLAEGSTISASNGQEFTISYVSGEDGKDVVLTPAIRYRFAFMPFISR